MVLVRAFAATPTANRPPRSIAAAAALARPLPTATAPLPASATTVAVARGTPAPGGGAAHLDRAQDRVRPPADHRHRAAVCVSHVNGVGPRVHRDPDREAAHSDRGRHPDMRSHPVRRAPAARY